MESSKSIENKRNKDYVEENFSQILNLFRNKFLVVHNQQIQAAFDEEEKATAFGFAMFGNIQPFIIYQVQEKKRLNFVFQTTL